MLRYLDHGAGGGFVRIRIDEDYARHSEAVLRETDSAMRGCRCHEEASAMNGLVRRRWFLFVVPAVWCAAGCSYPVFTAILQGRKSDFFTSKPF